MTAGKRRISRTDAKSGKEQGRHNTLKNGRDGRDKKIIKTESEHKRAEQKSEQKKTVDKEEAEQKSFEEEQGSEFGLERKN